MYEEMVKRQQREKEAESSAAAVVVCFVGVLCSWPKIRRSRNGTTPKELGNTCYPESFAIWKAKFDSEMQVSERTISTKPTGRELFERNGKSILENEDASL